MEADDTSLVSSVSAKALAATGRRLLSMEQSTWLDPDAIMNAAQAACAGVRMTQQTNACGRLLHSFMSRDNHAWSSLGQPERWFQGQQALLKEMCLSTSSLTEKRRRSRDVVLSDLSFYLGLDLMIAHGELYQLGQPQAWYRPGAPEEFLENEAECERLLELGRSPLDVGYILIDGQTYLDRIRVPLLRLLINDSEQLRSTAWWIVAFTATSRERGRFDQTTKLLVDTLRLSISASLATQITPIPLHPLYSLAKESRNLGSLTIGLSQNEDSFITEVEGKGTDARAKLYETGSGRQQLLLFDDKLVNRKKAPDQYIQIPLTEKTSNVLDALTTAMAHLPIRDKLLEHLPRITAAFFNAAMRDRRMSAFSAPGTFWDTNTGRRLCRIAGLNPDNPKHQKIVTDVRSLLENVILHREVREYVDGGYRAIEWSGPLLEARKGDLSTYEFDREGCTRHSNFKSWSIAHAVWQMVVPKEDGGSPTFMALDERAFFLDEKSKQASSVPFNLYWTLINRSYMGRLNSDGDFVVGVGVLVEWGGLQGKFKRPVRMREVLFKALDAMTDHDLIQEWSIPGVHDDIQYDELMELSLKVRFSSSQLQSLQHLVEPT